MGNWGKAAQAMTARAIKSVLQRLLHGFATAQAPNRAVDPDSIGDSSWLPFEPPKRGCVRATVAWACGGCGGLGSRNGFEPAERLSETCISAIPPHS
jgi:hypothetical protein